LARSINVTQLKQAFRQAALQRDIDPDAGATSYQAANVQAELRKRHKNEAEFAFWEAAGGTWRRRRLWADAGRSHSQTESAALKSILQQCQDVPADNMEDCEFDFWAHVFSLVKADLAHEASVRKQERPAPLRDIHTARGIKIEWINVETGLMPVETALEDERSKVVV
jgi:hypothetical protein